VGVVSRNFAVRNSNSEAAMKFEAMKVGELAKRTGLTVRTLHHYDEIGLLKPSLHGGSGYRLYTAADLARLQHVLSLRQLGFSLDEIRDCLSRADFAPLEVTRLHLSRLREQIDLQQKLCERLETIAAHFDAAEEVSADEFLQTIEAIMMTEKYFTPEQQELIKASREKLGEKKLQEQQEAWAKLIAEIRAEKDAGTDPAAANVQALAKRWTRLVEWSTGGDDGIKQSIKRLWDEQGDALAEQHGAQYDPRPVFDYIERALAAGKTQ
jgi:DNA-binding transcriptional MerR regulator